MNKICFSIALLFAWNSSKAQLHQNWVNDFCCFDSVQPHTFSYPMGKSIDGDTLFLSFYEDGFLNLKKINLATGNDAQFLIHPDDTIESPFFFGGGTTFLQNSILSSAVKFDGITGNAAVWLSSFDRNFNSQWSIAVASSLGRVSKPVTDPANANFYFASVSDSIRLFRFTVSGNAVWENSLPAGTTSTNVNPVILVNAFGQPVLLTEARQLPGFDLKLRLTLIDPASGSIIVDSIFNNSGTNFVYTESEDTLRIAYIKSSSQTVSFMNIDLASVHLLHENESAVLCFSTLTKCSFDTTLRNTYLKTSDAVLAFSQQDSALFNATIPTSSYDTYSTGGFDFDNTGNLLLSYSFHNTLNNPPNSDLVTILMNKLNGNMIDSIHYNDARNTSEIFIDQFLHNGFYHVLFANDFDNFAILHEETQLGIIEYSYMPLSSAEHLATDRKPFIYPNPASNFLSVSLPVNNPGSEIRIFNTLGQLKFQSKTENNRVVIDVSSFTDGLFILEISDASVTRREKFLIHK